MRVLSNHPRLFAMAMSARALDVIFCFGVLHRVENPLGLMRALGERLAPGGRLLVETYGIAHDGRVDERAIEVQQRGGIYPGDEFVYWGFGAGGLTALAGLAGFAEATIEATPTIDGHPRVLGALVRPGA